MRQIGVGLIGFGTVGAGVVDGLQRNRGKLAERLGIDIVLKKVADLDITTDRGITIDKSLLTTNAKDIVGNPEIDIVVELIGGTGFAKSVVKDALSAGQSVVTANKKLLAEYGSELFPLAESKGVDLYFGASVGGGIPIIRPISQCLAANNIDEICGILNGTTNYILTSMGETGVDFDEALTQAQAKGYAEANPAADIQGHDTCRKICILASLSFGHHIYPDKVQTQGIEQITSQDIQYAKENNFAIKLIGRAKRLDNQTACVYVAPHMVKNSNVLANVSDVFNGITINGDAIGEVIFYGRGAGAMPTASAVVADVIDAVKHFHAHKYLSWEKSTGDPVPPNDIATPWYLRDGNKQTITPTLTDWKPWASENGFSEAAFAMRVL